MKYAVKYVYLFYVSGVRVCYRKIVLCTSFVLNYIIFVCVIG